MLNDIKLKDYIEIFVWMITIAISVYAAYKANSANKIAKSALNVSRDQVEYTWQALVDRRDVAVRNDCGACAENVKVTLFFDHSSASNPKRDDIVQIGEAVVSKCEPYGLIKIALNKRVCNNIIEERKKRDSRFASGYQGTLCCLRFDIMWRSELGNNRNCTIRERTTLDLHLR